MRLVMLTGAFLLSAAIRPEYVETVSTTYRWLLLMVFVYAATFDMVALFFSLDA